MNPRHKASAGAITLVKLFEGYRARSARLPDGRWTIGYGHTKTARADAQVSEADAEALLHYDLMPVQAVINDAIFTPLNQNQYDALVSFVFNVGVDNFRRSSVLRRINEGNLIQAACALEMWRKADLDGERIVVDALVRRRAAEKTLFLTPLQGWVPAPSPIVRPRVDYEVGLSLPRTSVDVTVSMTGDRGEARRADAPATVAAAAAVSARLQAIAADPSQFAEAEAGLDLTPQPVPPEEDPEPDPSPIPAPPSPPPSPPPEPAPEPAPVADPPTLEAAPAPLVLTPPPESQPQPVSKAETAPLSSKPAPAPEQFDEVAPLDIPSHMSTDSSRRIVRREAPIDVEDAPFFDEGSKIGGLPLLGLGLAGLAVFAGSVFWGVNAKGSGGPLDPMVVASVLGLVGIAFVASAVYFLLVRLGGRSD